MLLIELAVIISLRPESIPTHKPPRSANLKTKNPSLQPISSHDKGFFR